MVGKVGKLPTAERRKYMTEASRLLEARVVDLRARMQLAGITPGELKVFHKVAAIMEAGQGRIHPDDLIAASFVTDVVDK